MPVKGLLQTGLIFLVTKVMRDLKNISDPDVIRTRSLLIWSQTRYRCATESLCSNDQLFQDKKRKVLPRFELGSLDSKSRVLTITP